MEFSEIQRILTNSVCEPQEDPKVESISHRELEDRLLQLADIREFHRLQTEEAEDEGIEESDLEHSHVRFVPTVSRKRAFHEVFGQDSDSDSDSDSDPEEVIENTQESHQRFNQS
jgi:hypothetical protein